MVWGARTYMYFPLENVHSTCTWTLLLSRYFLNIICLVTYVVISGARLALMPRVLICRLFDVFVRSNMN